MATLERIFVHPIKSLDATAVEAARVVANGGLDWDRRYAVVDTDGDFVNGKREPRVHRLRASYDLGAGTVTLAASGVDAGPSPHDPRTFDLEADRDALTDALSAVLDRPVDLVRDDEGGFPDDADASGPTVIASGTLERVASWFDGIDAAELRRRLRPNLVVDAPAFWEDRLYDAPGHEVPFEVGSVAFRGVNPCQRCVVPTRDPDTGEPTEGFRETFVRRREATLPAWATRERFDHYYRLMVNTRVPEDSWGGDLATGDAVSIGDSVATSV